MIVVGDIPPLMALVKTGRLGLLKDLHREIIVPEGVREEYLRKERQLPWFIKVKRPANESKVAELRAWLDEQEAEAIALAKELTAEMLLMDDHIGRRLARRDGVQVTGLLGILIAAKRAGLIASVRDVFFEIKTATGFRVREEVESRVFVAAGE